MITIRHTHAEGTRLEGSTKGDGVYELLVPLGWTWRPWAGIHIRGTRDTFVYRFDLNRYAEVLRAAGYEVTVDVDNTWRPAAIRWAERGERAEGRAEHLDERADKTTQRAIQARDARRRISDGIPLGQPKLIGHHSYGRACRDEQRMNNLDRRSFAEADHAHQLAGRADGARRNESAKHNPRAIMRKIDQLETDVRRMQRALADTSAGEWAEITTLRVARDQEEIAYLQNLLDQHADSGTFVAWSPQTIAKGDLVRVAEFGWYLVKRVNRKSVSLDTNTWPHIAEWDRITARRRDGMQLDTPNGQPWPAELADKISQWRQLQRAATTTPHDEDTRRQQRHTAWAQRLVHGLDHDAADAELAIIQDQHRTTDERRALACRYLETYQQLQAGASFTQVAESVTPEPSGQEWRLPLDREPEDRRAGPTGYHNDTARLVAPGDLIKGYYDTGMSRRLVRSFCGPVQSVSPVNHRREAGDWVTIALHDGTTREFPTHVWLAVYPAAIGTPAQAAGPEAGHLQ